MSDNKEKIVEILNEITTIKKVISEIRHYILDLTYKCGYYTIDETDNKEGIIMEMENEISLELEKNEVLWIKLYDIIRSDGNMIKYVPKNMLTQEMCKIAFEYNYETIQYFRDDLKTNDMCNKAYMLDKDMIKYIPEKYKISY